MEEDFYLEQYNLNLVNTIYHLAEQYSNLGNYYNALQTYKDVLGIKKEGKNKM